MIIELCGVVCMWSVWSSDVFGFVFFFQAEDGIRDAQESRGLGDVYKRQLFGVVFFLFVVIGRYHFTIVING